VQAKDTPFGCARIPWGSPKSALESSKEERQKMYEECWDYGGHRLLLSYPDLLINIESNNTVASFMHEKIRQLVKDPKTADLLCPADYPFAAKRVCLDAVSYYATFNRDNVTLVNIKETPIEEITPNGISVGGKEYEVDSLVLATGYDAMTGALAAIDIKGVGGETLKNKWHAGATAYLGLMTAEFPNFFVITGPGSPSVLGNVVVSIEQHIDWVAGCLDYLRKNNLHRIEATPKAEKEWADHVNFIANYLLYTKANSWYLGANIPGKPRLFLPYAGGFGAFKKKCDEVAANGYEGFSMA